MSVHDEVQMQVTKTVQNIPPFAWTQARSLERHWSITSSMMLCFSLSHTSIKRCFISSTSHTFAQ